MQKNLYMPPLGVCWNKVPTAIMYLTEEDFFLPN